MSFPMKGLFSSSPCLWQNSLQSQWEQDYPANISVTNRASLKSVFWHWRESFITIHHCKLYQGGSSSLLSSLSVSSSNIAADRHTRDVAGKQWRCCFTGNQWPDERVFVSASFPWNVIDLSVPSKSQNRQLWNQKTYYRNCKAIWRIHLFCPCEMGTVVQQYGSVLPHSLMEAGSLAGVLLALLKAAVWLVQAGESSRLLFSCSWPLTMLNLPLIPAGE